MQLHHIVQESNGGPDTLENCIPLCLECHEEVGSYNPGHPIGRKFTPDELRGHRNVWFNFVKSHPERLSYSSESLFRITPEVKEPTPDVLAMVEPFYHTVTTFRNNAEFKKEEMFAAKVRNQGVRAIYIDTIGFTIGEQKYPGLFSPYSGKDHLEAKEISVGRFQVFSLFGLTIDKDPSLLDGMYVITGSGHEFVNKDLDLRRFIEEWRKQAEDKRFSMGIVQPN
jgi:hypothetical protein